MANVTTVRLPDALLLSNDYVALNTDQRESFLARIMHCMEIAAAAEIAASQTGNEFLSGIDDIELDAFSVMSSSSDIARSVSPYLVHSSWTFESDKVGLSAQVDKVTAEFLSSASFLLHSSEAEMDNERLLSDEDLKVIRQLPPGEPLAMVKPGHTTPKANIRWLPRDDALPTTKVRIAVLPLIVPGEHLPERLRKLPPVPPAKHSRAARTDIEIEPTPLLRSLSVYRYLKPIRATKRQRAAR
jgi:hypothetical protein